MSDERDETRQFSPFDDQAEGDDATVVTPQPGRPDSTSVMPPATAGRGAEDWAASRGRAWSGRAEVRTAQPGSSDYQDTDWANGSDWTNGTNRESRDRWWLPIVIGVVALVLLAGVGYGFYLLVRNSDSNQPATTITRSAAPGAATTATTAATKSTPPSTAPTTTEPASEPASTEPTPGSVTIPALKGLSLAEAQAALQQERISYRLLYRVSDGQPGTVIDSDPPEGQEVPPDTTVTLVIAAAQPTTPTATLTTGPTNSSGEGGD